MSLLALWRGEYRGPWGPPAGLPQRQWVQLTDNFEGLFVPKLPSKPFFVVSLDLEIQKSQKERFRDVARGLRHKRQRGLSRRVWDYHQFLQLEGQQHLPNPYRREIKQVRLKPPDERPLSAPPVPPSSSPLRFTLVSSLADLQAFVDAFQDRSCSMLAVSVKSCSRSYRGFCCCLVLSTEDQNYLIDPFRIYPYLYKLNSVTANPKILKVFCNAKPQLLHLQRDFSVYVVNCFDVALAENVFSAAAASPSSLVLKYLGKRIPETTEDQFVQRPFSADFLTKVFEETKFLPFVARCLYNRLVASNSKEEPCSVERAKNPNGCTPKRGGVALLSGVFADSQGACLAVYRHPKYRPAAEAKKILKDNNIPFSGALFHVVERLLEWRDIRARMADVERRAICPDEKIMEKAIEVWGPLPSAPSKDEMSLFALEALYEFGGFGCMDR